MSVDAKRGSRGIAPPMLNLGARRGGWETPCPGHFACGNDSVLILYEAELPSGPLRTGVENRKSLTPTRVQTIPNRPAHSRPYMTYGVLEFLRPSGSLDSLSHKEKFDKSFENFTVVIFSLLFFILRKCKKA
jgi:hypothetical protein